MAVSEGRAAAHPLPRASALPGATLTEYSLDTGRTHQIRVHLQAIGHPLVGIRCIAPGAALH